MVVVDGGEAGEQWIETQQEQPGEQASGQESKPVQQEAEGEASRGAAHRSVRGSRRPSAGIRWDYKTKQNQYFVENFYLSITLQSQQNFTLKSQQW